MSVNSKMTAIADKTRELVGVTEKLGMDAMATNLGTAVDACDSQAALIEQIKTALEGKAAGDSGGGIRIKAYATEEELMADSPEANTIGVITETTVSGFLFSPREPDTPSDGMLWIQTGYDTEPFLADSIEVCPIYAKQLISGKWTAVAAMTYTDGTWKSWKVPLYTKGDEHRPWTGGWALKDLSYSGTVFKAPTITRYADYVELKQNTITQGGVYHCVKPVDLTGRKTLYFDGILKSTNTTLPHWVGIFLWTSLGEHVEDNFVTEFNSPVSGAVSFDVEQFDGEYCIGIFVYQNGSSATLREMYVE